MRYCKLSSKDILESLIKRQDWLEEELDKLTDVVLKIADYVEEIMKEKCATKKELKAYEKKNEAEHKKIVKDDAKKDKKMMAAKKKGK